MLDKPEDQSFDKLIESYVRMRDALKESDKRHKEKTATARQWLKDQNLAIVGRLQALSVDNVGTPHGVAYQSLKKSATVADGSIFWEFVVEHIADGGRALIDVRANAPAVSTFIKTHGTPPPGVNYTETYVAGVRRAGEEEEQ